MTRTEALRAVAHDIRVHADNGLQIYSNVAQQWAARIEAAMALSEEEREALEVCATVPWLMNSEKWVKCAAVLKRMLEGK